MTTHILPDENHFQIGVHLEQIDAIADAVRGLDEKGNLINGSGLSKHTLTSMMILIMDKIIDIDKLLTDLQTVH